MTNDTDALVIGAGPAGASAAILLAQTGWRVVLVEQHRYPRQKVCGECISAGNFSLIDKLGIGLQFRRLAGVDLTTVAWMSTNTTLIAAMPACADGIDRYGKALGRDQFDSLLLERARALGVRIVQPAKVRAVQGRPGDFQCNIADLPLGVDRPGNVRKTARTLSASIIIDAHGSWESGPHFENEGAVGPLKPALRASDLFAFKSTFYHSALSPGLLPVVALPGGYGGLVVANQERTTIAYCLRRDVLQALRARNHDVAAGVAVEGYLRHSCPGVRDALRDAQREGCWLSVGPLRPGIRLTETAGVFRVGNAAGETHPLIGEGITMALQSSHLLVDCLTGEGPGMTDARRLIHVQRVYSKAWRRAFVPRMRFAAGYAHLAMRPRLAAPARNLMRRWPILLTEAARLAGKARHAIGVPT